MKNLLLVLCLLAAFLVPPAPAQAQRPKTVRTGGPFAVETVTGVAYHQGKDADAERHLLDLYLPKGQKGYPVLFFVHGGAWRMGSKNLYAPLGRTFAKNGIGMVVINYRLSPKVKHPAHVEDVARAFAWTHGNIGKYGGRADQIFACGHSAGGHLVALLATDESHLKAHKLSLKDIKGVLPLSGVYTILPLSIFEPAFGKDAKVCKDASPSNHVNGRTPPALIIYAEKDYFMLDSMAEQFCKKLKGCSCEAASLKIPNRDHISIIVMMASETDPTTQAMFEFIAQHSGLRLVERRLSKE